MMLVLIVFSITAFFTGCRHDNNVDMPVKTPREAPLTITGDNKIAEDEIEEKQERKKMLPVSVVQTMPYYYIAVFNEGSDDSADELNAKFSHLIEMVNAADYSNIKLTLMFCPKWAEMFSKNSSKLALLHEWKQNGHEISCYHSSIYGAVWDGYTDLPYDEALKTRQEIADKKDEQQYAGTMADYISELKKISMDIKSGYVESGEKNYSYDLFNNIGVKEKYFISGQVIYYTYPGKKDFNVERELQHALGHYTGLNKFILTVNTNSIAGKYLSHLDLETKASLESAIKASESYSSSYVLGIAVLNDINFIKYYFSLLQYIQMLDPEGLNSRTLTQVMEEKILKETLPENNE